jgi:hypothetical protein
MEIIMHSQHSKTTVLLEYGEHLVAEEMPLLEGLDLFKFMEMEVPLPL